jgi:hypothetical protein
MDEDSQLKKRKWRRRFFIAVCLLIIVVLIIPLFAWWVMIRMPGKSFSGALPPSDDQLEALEKELRSEIVNLASEIGDRNILNSPEQLAQAADYIESKFTSAGLKVKRQGYDVSGRHCDNLEVEIFGTGHPDKIVIIGAHYDTMIGTPGANDNASGIAAMLALARRFSNAKIDHTLRFVAFVNEEPPFFQTAEMGSWLYAKRCKERSENIVGMISLETIGYYSDTPGSQRYPPPFSLLYPSQGNFIGFIGNTASGDLVRKVVASFRQNEHFPSEGAAIPEILIRAAGFSDQWSFWQEGYPALMATDTAMSRYAYYHKQEDTVDKICFDRMARVVRGLEKVIAELVGENK